MHADPPGCTRQHLCDLIEIGFDARPDTGGGKRVVPAGCWIEIDGKIDRRLGGLAELLRQTHGALGVLAALFGGFLVLQIEVHALRTAMLKHHEDRQARALDCGQLGLGQGLQWMVVAGLANAAAIGAIIVASDGLDAGALQLRQIRRDIEVGVDDLGAVGSRIERQQPTHRAAAACACDPPEPVKSLTTTLTNC